MRLPGAREGRACSKGRRFIDGAGERAAALLAAVFACLAVAMGVLVLVESSSGESEAHAKRFAACLQRHGWTAVRRPNKLLAHVAARYITGWSDLDSDNEPGYAIVEPYAGGHFELLAIGGRGMPRWSQEAVLLRRIEHTPGEFDGVMVWIGSKQRGAIIEGSCLSAAGVPALP